MLRGTLAAAIEHDVADATARASLLRTLDSCVNSQEVAPELPPPPYGAAAAAAAAAASLRVVREESGRLRVEVERTHRDLVILEAEREALRVEVVGLWESCAAAERAHGVTEERAVVAEMRAESLARSLAELTAVRRKEQEAAAEAAVEAAPPSE